MRISDWSSDVCSSDLRGLWPESADRARESSLLVPQWLYGQLRTASGLRLVELVRLLFERLVGRDVRRQDPIEVLDLLDRKSVVEGKRGSVRVDLGGGRIVKKKKKKKKSK